MIRRDVLGHGLDTVGWKKSGDFKPPEIYKGLLKACKMGINYQPQQVVSRISEPTVASTVVL